MAIPICFRDLATRLNYSKKNTVLNTLLGSLLFIMTKDVVETSQLIKLGFARLFNVIIVIILSDL